MNRMFAGFLLASMSALAQAPNQVGASAVPKISTVAATVEKNAWKDPITWFTGGLLIIGGLQVLVYWKQKNLMEKSLDASYAAAESARQSAVVAMNVQSARIALLRVVFGSTGASNWDARLQSPSIEVVLKNYGATTAFVESVGLEVIWGVNLPPEPDSTHSIDVEPETVIDPQEIYTLRNKDYRRMIPSEDLKAIKEQKMFIWVYGHLQYRDFLNQQHITRFCKQLLPSMLKNGHYQFVETTHNALYTNSG